MKLPSPTAAFPSMIGSPTPSLTPAPVGEGSTVLPGRMNWEPVQKRLLGPDMKDALLAATELREGIEIVHTTEYPNMLAALLPAFSSILSHKTGPSPDISTLEHKLRNVVLEIISRFPSNEVLRPHAPHMVAVALDILNRDFEDNSLIASRIIFDLYKVYRSLPQDYVQPYLDFVQTAYRTLPAALQRNFSLPALAAVLPPGSQLAKAGGSVGMGLASAGEKDLALADSLLTPAKGSSDISPSVGITASPMLPASPVPRMALRSNSSFRVLTECPLIVMLMFQLYPKFLKSNIPTLINIMMEALTLRAPSIQTITAASSQTLDSNAQRLYFSRCRELVAAQAKTLSFLTYLLRGFSSELKPYEDRLATNVVALMSTCPREFISTRKELLVATRHLLNSDFRNGFFRHVDALLDERVLMGSHHRYSDQTILRPLGYTTLSDLVHHVRSMLTMPQMSRVVCMFSRVLHDSSMTLPMSTQYTAVRTLLSVVDIVFHNKDRNPQIGRDILVRILKTLVDKLSTLKGCYLLETTETTKEQELSEDAKHSVGQNAEEALTTSSMKDQSEGGSVGGLDDQMLAKLELPVGTDPAESIRDLKSMVRAIIVGHKTVIWYINNYRAQREKDKVEYTPPPGSNEEVASAMLKMTHLEHALIDQYIVLALPCMKLLRSKSTWVTPGSQAHNKRLPNDSASTGTPDQYRDALTYFAAAFTTLDGYELRRTLGRRLELVVDAIVEDPTVMIVPRHLLQANEATSFAFSSVLLGYLVERMDKLSSSVNKDVVFVPPPTENEFNEVERLKSFSAALAKAPTESADLQKQRSTIYLQLFERILKSLSTYPENESALRPHLRRIVSTCLLCSMGTSGFHPDNYCMLLRYVFRSISAGKFEESYRELLPLIPTVLNGLYRVLRATDDSVHHYTIIELLLTIPARLSSLLPHMNLLLRVIVRALQASSGDLVNLGYVFLPLCSSACS
jgi:transformation/transcription domain-associated protein